MKKIVVGLIAVLALAVIAMGIASIYGLGGWSWLVFAVVLFLGGGIWSAMPTSISTTPTPVAPAAPVAGGATPAVPTPIADDAARRQQARERTYATQNVAIVIAATACMVAFIIFGCWAAKDIAGLGKGYNEHPTATKPTTAWHASTGTPKPRPVLPSTIPIDKYGRGIELNFARPGPGGGDITTLPTGTKVQLTANDCGKWYYRIMTKKLEKVEKSRKKDNPSAKFFVQWRNLPPELDGETIEFSLIRAGWVEVRVEQECQIAGRIVSLGAES